MSQSKFFETKKFKDLAAEWEKKLERSGLENIEQVDGRLKKWSSDKFSRRPEWNASKAEYYRAAGNFLHEYKFKSKLERLVWEHHAEGATNPEIAIILKKARSVYGYQYVRYTIRKLSKIMLQDLIK